MGISVVPFPGIYVVKVFYVDFCLCPPGYIGEKTLFVLSCGIKRL